MVTVPSVLRRWFGKSPPVPPGLYHYRRDSEGRALRLHLRADLDGLGLLSVNASGVIHLNETALFLVKLILDGVSQEEAMRQVDRHYRGAGSQALADYQRLQAIVRDLESSEDACPLTTLGLPFGEAPARRLAAPYRADLALTYACENRCRHCYVGRAPGTVRELPLADWQRLLGILWSVGVPHVCFTGGEATESALLLPLIEKAEDLGMVTGLLTNGRRLADRAFAGALCAAGLDHAQITIESADEAVHDQLVGAPGAWKQTVEGIRNAVAEDLYLVTNTTLCRPTVAGATRTVEFVASLGVRQFAMNGIIHTGKAPAAEVALPMDELAGVLDHVIRRAEDLGLRFIWYTPTRYCQLNPMERDLGPKRCTAAEYAICIEPDGSVLPCQSYYESAGNLLADPWDRIWNSRLFRDIRERAKTNESCRQCPDFAVCGGGCPLDDGTRFTCHGSSSGG
jgi:radical SAM protein with 4Fe4S-binding SPASM domain